MVITTHINLLIEDILIGMYQIYNSKSNEYYNFVDNVKYIYRRVKISKDRSDLIK